MATMTREEAEIYNKNELDKIKNSGPGTYELKYAYYVESTNRTIEIDYTINVGDIDANASINYNGPGRGGSNEKINEYLASTPHNSIDIQYGHFSITETGGNQYYYDGTACLISDIADTFDIGQSVLYDGHSYSADFVTHMGVRYAITGKSDNLFILCSEPDANYQITESERQALIDSDATVVNVFCQSYLYGRKKQYDSCYEGVHTLDIKINAYEGNDIRSCHNLPIDLLAKCGITNLANGTFDFTQLPDTFYFSETGKTYDITYDFVERYYNENNEYVERTYHVDPSNREALIELNAAICPEVMSDFEYLESRLTSINSIINSSKVEFASKSYASDTIVPSGEIPIVSGILASYNKLLNLFLQETSSIVKIGEGIRDMEVNLDNIASTLGMEINSTIIDEVPLINYKDEEISIADEETIPIVEQQVDDKPGIISIVDEDDKPDDGGTIIKIDEDEKSDDEGTITKVNEDDKPDDESTTTIIDEDENQSVDAIRIVDEREKSKDKIEKILAEKEETNKVVDTIEKEKISKNVSNIYKINAESSNEVNQSPIIKIDDNYFDEGMIKEEKINIQSEITQKNVVDPVISDNMGYNSGNINENIVIENNNNNKSNLNTLKTLGAIAGIGAGLGTAAYGINQYIKDKEDDNEYNYSYINNDEVKYDIRNEESDSYTPYIDNTNGGEK